MMNIAILAHHTIAVLSPAFLEATFVQPEWAAALRQDPTGMGRKIIPVRVKACQPQKSLVAQIVYIDLVECPRDSARSILLDGVREGRAKPKNEPPFPGTSII
jgi:TIR domain-containing protein